MPQAHPCKDRIFRNALRFSPAKSWVGQRPFCSPLRRREPQYAQSYVVGREKPRDPFGYSAFAAVSLECMSDVDYNGRRTCKLSLHKCRSRSFPRDIIPEASVTDLPLCGHPRQRRDASARMGHTSDNIPILKPRLTPMTRRDATMNGGASLKASSKPIGASTNCAPCLSS